MILAVCIDDSNGLMFNNRRLSSDKAVVHDILQIAGTNTIIVNPYSAPLFQGFESQIAVKDDHLNERCDFCFAEFGDVLKVQYSVDTLIVYKWNRHYPSDMKFPLDAFKSRMKLESTAEFEGSSHLCISREVYVR